MKKIVMCFTSLILVLLLMPSVAFATSYEYIIDNANLFDDSNDMISMSKEIRNKLDFDIHIYSMTSLEDTEEIIKQHMQNSSVLLIFISEQEEMSWYSGSSVQRTIRDVDFENLFSHVSVSHKQYTQAVNFILSKILSIYVYGNETIDDYALPSDYYSNTLEDESWLSMNLQYFINYIRKHPVEILVTLVVLVGCFLYILNKYYKKPNAYDDFEEEDIS